jgi:hypothetical protein
MVCSIQDQASIRIAIMYYKNENYAFDQIRVSNG